jgi:hypothetical protein
MRWFYMLLTGTVIAGIALVAERLMGVHRPAPLQAMVGAGLIIIVVSLFGFLSKHRD